MNWSKPKVLSSGRVKTIRLITLALIALFASGCGQFRWQPYFEPDDTPGGGVLPSVTFVTLGACQQYLHLRFGNLRSTGTLYCLKNCRTVRSDSTEIPATAPGSVRIGNVQCPLVDRQIVGELIGSPQSR